MTQCTYWDVEMMIDADCKLLAIAGATALVDHFTNRNEPCNQCDVCLEVLRQEAEDDAILERYNTRPSKRV